MGDFWVVPLCLATLLCGFSVFSLFLWVKRTNRKRDLILSLMFLVMGFYCFVGSQILRITEPSQAIRWLRLSIAADETVALLFIWYLAVISAVVSRKALIFWSCLFLGFCLVTLSIPERFIVIASHNVEFTVLLPLGFRATYRFVALGPLAILMSLMSIAFVIQCFAILVRYSKNGHKRPARKIGLVFTIVVLSVLNDVLVGSEVYHSMFLTSFGWAIALFALSFDSWKEILEGEAAVKTLEKTQAQFVTMLKNAPMSIWMGDTEGRMILQNDASIALVGHRIGETSLDGKFPKGTEAIWDLNKRALLGETGEGRVVYRVGTEARTFRVVVAPNRAEQRIIGTFGFGVDVSQQVQAEEEEDRLRNQLLQAQKMEGLGLLAGGIAHDMNNILAAILAIASTRTLILPEGDANRNAFEKVKRAAERGGKLVKTLLSFARKKNSEEKDTDINAIVQETVSLLKSTSQSAVSIDVKLEPRLRHVLGDSNALSAVMINLYNNALDAMPEAGTLTVSTKNIGTESIEILVEDTGAGMTDEVIARAVEPFFTTKPEGAGTGLGLSQAFRIVQAHRGTLAFASSLGRGTSVSIVLPSCPQQETTSEGLGTQTALPASRELNFLVVDDDELVLDAAVETLRALGHRVASASSGEEALSKLEALEAPDIIVLDLNMPGMNGEEVLIRLRKKFPVLPVLLSSGRTDDKALRLVETFAHVMLLPKPYSIDEVETILDKLISE